MEGIEHRTLSINGINMHIAEKGQGPLVLFVHGFPELWYSWRHQILGLAARGYRCVAPDMRGYGDTDAPASHASYTIFHIVGDLIALLDALSVEQVLLVGHDWGAIICWNFCMFRPDRVKALFNLSMPHWPRNPAKKPISGLREVYGNDHYMCKFQVPGEAEAEFSSYATAEIMKGILGLRNPDPIIRPEEKLDSSRTLTLPSWLSEDELNYYVSKFEKTGFTGGFNYYRNLDLNWELTGAWTGAQIKVPVKFMLGDLDLTYYMPGAKDYIHKGGFKKDVPFLQEVIVMEGVGHFINQERPDEITEHIFNFFQKF